MPSTSLRRLLSTDGVQDASVVGQARRLVNRTRREAVARVPVLRERERRQRAQIRAQYQPLLPPLADADGAYVGALADEGVLVTTLGELGLPHTDELRRRADLIRGRLAERKGATDDSTIRATNDDLAEDPVIWRWGLDERLLTIVEHHLGMPARYYGAEMRLELPDSRVCDVRQWHRDVEDDRLFKVLIWINDVGPDGGPFEFVDRRRTESATTAMSYVSGFVDDDHFASYVPVSRWQQAVGPRWTAAIADTAAVFHRAKPPSAVERYSITYTYSTSRPRKVYPKRPFTPARIAAITNGLSPRQLSALPAVIGA